MFTSAAGPQSRYEGVLHRAGVDVGFTQESVLRWAVFAPMHRIGPGDLAGRYGVRPPVPRWGFGGNADALVGGANNFFALQPLSFEGQTGLNVAVGVAGRELRRTGAYGTCAHSSPPTAPTRLSSLILVLSRT